MSILKAENLSLKVGAKEIIKNMSWEIQPGENWVLFGLNGCGKTTLLSIMSAYQSGNLGATYICDQKVNEDNFFQLRREVGFVSSSFFDRFLKKEIVLDVVLAGKYGSLGFQEEEPSDDDIRYGKHLLRELGIESRARYPYDILSKGQQQRVLIARGLMGNPKILLLDEPCSGLDIVSRERFLRFIQDLANNRTMSMIYVTHHTDEILPFFDKAALMREGELHSKGDLYEVFSDENVSDFLKLKASILWTEQHFFINLELPENSGLSRRFRVNK